MSAASAGGGDADVLVVEDRDSLRTMLRLALESQGYRALEARDQHEAEALLTRHQPAVVITDLRLPHGDGLGVLSPGRVAVRDNHHPSSGQSLGVLRKPLRF